MQRRPLGQQGTLVSAIGLGCWGMSGAYGAADQAEAAATLHHALDSGISFLDTADCYADGHNESLLGRVLKSRRHEFALATKTGLVTRTDAGGKRTVTVDNRPQRVLAACDASLHRLQTDVIDLYYLHRVDPEVPIEESVGAVADLVNAGKVRFLGLCEVAAATLRRAFAVHPVAAVQSEYSLWTRDVEREVLPACEELGVSLVPFSPLGRGFLTGSVSDSAQIGSDDWRSTNPRFTADNLRRNTALLAPLRRIAESHGRSMSQIALAWVLSRGSRVIPIPGTKRRSHLVENLEALNVELQADELETLDRAFPPGVAAGERYTPDFAKWVDR